MPEIALIVPARLESTRFPRKLLHPIRGKPLLLWVAERISAQASGLPLYFAVDSPVLGEVLASGGFASIPTSGSHASGTDRIAEANRTVGASWIINIQADEPLVSGRQIELLAEFRRGEESMATLSAPFERGEDFLNPNQVKVVTDTAGRALYFSRAAIPFPRDRGGIVDAAWLRANRCFKHLGMYAYTAEFLESFVRLPPGRLEQIERLEQLRALENGHRIAVGTSEDPSIGVDTLEDAILFEKQLAG